MFKRIDTVICSGLPLTSAIFVLFDEAQPPLMAHFVSNFGRFLPYAASATICPKALVDSVIGRLVGCRAVAEPVQEA
jgi:hypothetical protein